MTLLEADDILESGIEIVAQPPGKRLQNMLLLSGGEKAMTAIALVLAIFKYRPSPFCLLDEVDAPLDDANVGRFSTLVREMSETVQSSNSNGLASQSLLESLALVPRAPGLVLCPSVSGSFRTIPVNA